MNETTFKILNVLSRELGKPISINELTNKINAIYKKAHYKNIFEEIKTLEKHGIVKIIQMGKSSGTSLNLENYLTKNYLGEMEYKNRNNFLQDNQWLNKIFQEIHLKLNKKGNYFIESALIINPQKNANLNKIELIIFLRNALTDEEKALEDTITEKNNDLDLIHKNFNIRIDFLILTQNEFTELVKTIELNPLKEMLSNKIMLFGEGNYWLEITNILHENQVTPQLEELNLQKLGEKSIVYNLNRFGYSELGAKITEEKMVCIESIITTTLIQDDKRRIEAIPIILSKALNGLNRKPNYTLLAFLCKKYNKTGQILGLLNALNAIQPNKETTKTIETLTKLGIKEEKVDKKNIEQKMRLYNAI